MTNVIAISVYSQRKTSNGLDAKDLSEEAVVVDAPSVDVLTKILDHCRYALTTQSMHEPHTFVMRLGMCSEPDYRRVA
jgi:hypothetical protein